MELKLHISMLKQYIKALVAVRDLRITQGIMSALFTQTL